MDVNKLYMTRNNLLSDILIISKILKKNAEFNKYNYIYFFDTILKK